VCLSKCSVRVWIEWLLFSALPFANRSPCPQHGLRVPEPSQTDASKSSAGVAVSCSTFSGQINVGCAAPNMTVSRYWMLPVDCRCFATPTNVFTGSCRKRGRPSKQESTASDLTQYKQRVAEKKISVQDGIKLNDFRARVSRVHVSAGQADDICSLSGLIHITFRLRNCLEIERMQRPWHMYFARFVQSVVMAVSLNQEA